MGTEAQWRRLCEVVGLLDLADNPRFCNSQMWAEHRRELLEILNAQFKERSRDEWLKRPEGADIAVEPVDRTDEVFQDPPVLHSGMIQAIGHPTIGTLRLVGFPVRLNRTPQHLRPTHRGMGSTRKRFSGSSAARQRRSRPCAPK